MIKYRFKVSALGLGSLVNANRLKSHNIIILHNTMIEREREKERERERRREV